MFIGIWLATLALAWFHGLKVPPMIFIVMTVLALMELIAFIDWRPRKGEK